MSFTILNKWVAHTVALAFSLLMDSKSKYTSLTLAELSWVILDCIALNNDVELESIRSLINCATLKLPFTVVSTGVSYTLARSSKTLKFRYT